MSSGPRTVSHGNVSRRCINCSLAVPRHRTVHSLDELSHSALNILCSWIAPGSIMNGGILCVECYTLIQTHATSGVIPTPEFGHQQVCFGCGTSILRTRTRSYRVSAECPERNVILRLTPVHQISRLQRVCAACWRAANREVQRQQQQDASRPELQEINESIIETGPAIPVPPPLPPQYVGQQSRPTPKITSAVYRRASATSSTCLFVGCGETERLMVPKLLREMLLIHNKFFVPMSARICRHHLDNGSWSDLSSNLRDFTGAQFDKILDILGRAHQHHLDFDNLNNMAPHLCHYWLGMNSQQFDELLTCVPRLSQELKNPKKALIIYIVKLRTGESNERLATLFQIARSTLEKNMNIARKCLTEDFVCRYLGFDHLTVEQVDCYLRNKIIPEGLFGNPTLPDNVKPAIVMCDATYIFVQNSSNYLFQKDTYSLQKLDNLVKPFMIVCCDGYIIDCLGPFKATTNDATITRSDLNSEEGKLRMFFREGDIFILDRGFRDVIEYLEELNFKAYMPESLLEGERQLTTFQANKSRCVTMCRWVIEIVNGRVKGDFRLFRHVFNNRAATHLTEDFRIACALINKFHTPIADISEAREYVAIVESRLNLTNHLAEFVERENMNRRRAMFSAIDGEHPQLNDFPRLNIDDLKRFAVGSYQLKQARSYFGEHVRSTGLYRVEINSETEVLPLIVGVNNYLIRGRIMSRHVSGRTYFIYLLVSRDISVANTLNALVGYCCNCLVGKRTVGCCAHVMTVVWYLSWGRFNNIQAPAPYLDNFFEEGI